jgi:hypothetical protein
MDLSPPDKNTLLQVNITFTKRVQELSANNRLLKVLYMKNIYNRMLISIGLIAVFATPLLALKIPGNSTEARPSLYKDFNGVTYAGLAKIDDETWELVLKFREGLTIGKGNTRFMFRKTSSKRSAKFTEGSIHFLELEKIGQKRLLKARPVRYLIRLQNDKSAIDFILGTDTLKHLNQSGEVLHIRPNKNFPEMLRGIKEYSGITHLLLTKISDKAQAPSTSELQKLKAELDHSMSKQEKQAFERDQQSAQETDD